jgi:guanylate kinase
MENKLVHLDEFRKLLANYRISEEGTQVLQRTKLALLVAPTATGRNTIIRELMKTGEYHFIVSDTTRQPRVNDGIPEQDGREYWFRDEEEVLADLYAGKFLEAAIIHNQQVSGVSIRELEKARDEGKIATTDIEINGVHNIMQAKPDTAAIFVLPPNFTAWMARIDGRGDMDALEKRRRLESAVQEFKAALENDYFKFVINGTVEHAVQHIHDLAYGDINAPEQAEAHKLAEQLLHDTQSWLENN